MSLLTRTVSKIDIQVIAVRTIHPKVLPCYHCSKALQFIRDDGTLVSASVRRHTGRCVAWQVVIDGYMRNLHRGCAEELGFRVER